MQIGCLELQLLRDRADVEVIRGADIDTGHHLVTGVGALRGQEVDIAGQPVARMVLGAAEGMRQARRPVADRQLCGTAGPGDGVLDIDIEVVGGQGQPGNADGFENHTGGEGFRVFRLQGRIPARVGDNDGAELHVAPRHTGRLAVPVENAGRIERSPAGTRIAGGQLRFAQAREQFGNARRAKGARVGAAQLERRRHLPVDARLIVGIAAKQFVVRESQGEVEIQVFDARHVGEKRQMRLTIEFPDLDRSLDRVLGIAERGAGGQQGVRVKPAAVFAEFEAGRDAKGPGREMERDTRYIATEALLLIATGVALIEQDVVPDLGTQIAFAQYIGTGNAAAAAHGAIQGLRQPLGVDVIQQRIDGVVAAPVDGQIVA